MFDPFQDFESAGYLRNYEALKDLDKVKRQEHFLFELKLENTLGYLGRQRGPVTYEHFLRVHEILFEDFYPWAGRDRHMLGVGRLVGKGRTLQFEVSEQCRQAVEWGLRSGNDPERLRERPGEVMGAFAWGHPFLDGNGRTMLLVHTELCHRAGFAIDWTASRKDDYLAALTHELEHPRDRKLDGYLRRLVVDAAPREDWIGLFKRMEGLDGSRTLDDNVAYADDDRDATARYEDLKRTRAAR